MNKILQNHAIKSSVLTFVFSLFLSACGGGGSNKVDDLSLLNEGISGFNSNVEALILNDDASLFISNTDSKHLQRASALPNATEDITVYEDGEAGDTVAWDIYDQTPIGATITNVQDADLDSKVILFNGEGRQNGFRLGHNNANSNRAWNNITQKVISWDAQFSEPVSVFVATQTTLGFRWLFYTDRNSDLGISGPNNNYIHNGIGSKLRNGQWHRVNRDLEADLQKFEPNNSIVSVNGFLIRGSGRIDNISLLNNLPPVLPPEEEVIYESAEDGDTNEWDIYDQTPAGAEIENILDADTNSKVIKFTSTGRQNGFRLGHNNANHIKAWNDQHRTNISWDAKFSNPVSVFVATQTTLGFRYIFYTDREGDLGIRGPNHNYIHNGLGADLRDGQWHTINRDIEADLQKFEPNNQIVSVNGFLIRGSGRVDNIKLSLGATDSNHIPVAETQALITVAEDSVGNAITLIGTDADGDILGYAIDSYPANGSLSGSGQNYTYAPDEDYSGADSFTFTVTDGTDISTPTTINIAVTDDENHAPEASSQAVITVIKNSLNNAITLSGTDEDGDTLTYAIDSAPNGSLSGSGQNYTYTPDDDFVGSDSFTFTVNDGDDISDPATVSISVVSAPTQEVPVLSDADIQDYLATINTARSVARSCGVHGDFPAVQPVTWSDKLYKAAYEHSQDMTTANYFSHTGSGTVSDWSGFALNKQSSMVDRIENYDYEWSRVSENIAAGTVMDTAQEAMDGWLTSDGHCKNIMNPDVTQVGLALSTNGNAQYTNYWTQNFGKPLNPEPPVFENSVLGRVTSTTGAELSGVSVKILQNGNNIPVVTESTLANGGFNLDLPPEVEFTLTFTATGYANQVLPIKTATVGNAINLDITMIPRGQVQQIPEQTGSAVSVSGDNGAKVILDDVFFVDSQGNDVFLDDGVQVTITPVDVSTPVGIAAFPGDFAGVAEGETNPTPIISYGTVEYQFTRNSDGAVLQLADGQTADIEIPIYTTTHPDGTTITVGDTIQLWSLNEDTGIWTQEGTGTVVASDASPTGFALSASVSHFTWWNADVSMDQQAQVVISVSAPSAGSALIKTRTSANIPWGFNSSDTVINVGSSTGALAIPSDVEVCFWAEVSFTNGNSATTEESCLTAVAGSTNNVSLDVQGGSLNIVATDVSVSTHILNASYAPQIKIQPTTSESNIIYTIASGALPAGVELSVINSTTAVISGVPTEVGDFSIEVKGVNTDGEEAVIGISYEVIGGDLTSWSTGAYANNEDRSQVLSISGATSLVVTIVGEVESGYDYIYIYDHNGNQVKKISGSLNEEFLVTGGSSIRARLTSDSDVTRSGVTVSISLNEKPYLALLGEESIHLEIGETYVDAGATATDPQEGDISANIVTTGLPIDTSNNGTYTITYNVSDAEGNVASQVTRTVIVGDITTIHFGPNETNRSQELLINGATELRVTVVGQRRFGDSFFIADENGNNIIIPRVEYEGTGIVTYNADFLVSGSLITATYDSRYTTELSGITVTISIPQKPKITLLGDNEVSVGNGETYVDAGATVFDTQDGDISGNIVVTGLPIDTSVGGIYTITYNVTDSDENDADEVTRIVRVGVDRLSLLGTYNSSFNITEVTLSPDGNTAYSVEIYSVGNAQHTRTNILDVSNPESPTLLGSFEGGRNAVLSQDGLKLYYESGKTLRIVDISNPSSVVSLGSLFVGGSGPSGSIEDIVLSSDGTKAFVSMNALKIVDISDANNPTLLGTHPVAWYESVDELALSNDETTIYMSVDTGNGGDYLVSVNVTDPASPARLDTRSQGTIYNITVSSDDSKAYVAGRNEIEVINISDPANLRYVKRVSVISSFHSVGISKDELRAYSGDTYTSIFSSLDLSGSQGVMGSIDLETGGINDVVISDNSSIAFIAAGISGLKIVNLQAAVLNIKASNTNIVAYTNGGAEEVQIQSISAQSSVNYTIESGALPAGLTLTQTGDTTAMISGSPVEQGTFDLTVKGINADGEVALIQIQYTVSDTQPPAMSNLDFYSNDFINVNLNEYNSGGVVTTWTLTGCPPWFELDSATGILNASNPPTPDPEAFCDGTVRAENAGGFDEEPISIAIYQSGPPDGEAPQ